MSDDDILRVIRASEFPAVTARWVADTLEMERRPVHQRLEELHERGELERVIESAGCYLMDSGGIGAIGARVSDCRVFTFLFSAWFRAESITQIANDILSPPQVAQTIDLLF
ncbi:hypothetical protein [Haladaptatus pallidirubidus]|uniref:hypothetical protein n=1 Tax=Haladaptatus pallidirubidus TaxID=1008152 RepID=UPI001D10E3AF|nr:hypothetical protein [Haladaptatus pallidirubidus]